MYQALTSDRLLWVDALVYDHRHPKFGKSYTTRNGGFGIAPNRRHGIAEHDGVDVCPSKESLHAARAPTFLLFSFYTFLVFEWLSTFLLSYFSTFLVFEWPFHFSTFLLSTFLVRMAVLRPRAGPGRVGTRPPSGRP